MGLDKLRTLQGTTHQELARISALIRALATDIEQKQYTWEEKIESLVKLAKAVGTTYEAADEEEGSAGRKEARRNLLEAYREFCEWRHDEPYLVDEIALLLAVIRK